MAFLCTVTFLSWGFTDWREILHGGSVTSKIGPLLFLRRDSPKDGDFAALKRQINRE